MTISKFRKWNKISSALVYVLHKTRHKAFSHRGCAKTRKKCTKKCDAHAKLLFCLLNIWFLTFLLRPCRWILKSLLSNHYNSMAMSFDTKLHFWWRRHYRIWLDSSSYLAWFMATINTTVCWSSLFWQIYRVRVKSSEYHVCNCLQVLEHIFGKQQHFTFYFHFL